MTFGLALCASAALCASPPGSGGDASRSVGTERIHASARPPRGDQDMTMLSKKALRACRDPGVAIVFARVARAEIDNAGTRSETAVLDLAVERTICGEAPQTLSVWRYTSGGNTHLKEGSRYVVVCRRGPGPVDYGLGEFVHVPEGKESEIVEAHLAAVKQPPATGK